MSNLRKILIILYIVNICHSTYIKTEEQTINEPALNDQIDVSELPPTTQLPLIQNIQENEILQTSENLTDASLSSESTLIEASSAETEHVLTGDLFETHMTIKQKWSDDFLDKNSNTFRNLSKSIEIEILSFLDNSLEMENSVQRGSIILKNVLPSSIDGYIFATLIFEASEHVSGQTFFEKLDLRRLTYDKIYDLEINSAGFEVKAISYEELKKFDKQIECDNEFCKPLSQLTPNTLSSVLSDQHSDELLEKSDTCDPDEAIKRGSTSIYIFENNHQCVENVKKRSLMTTQKCTRNMQKLEVGEFNSENLEDLDLAASEIHSQTDKKMNEKDDEVIVVVRKRGDKVFIEI